MTIRNTQVNAPQPVLSPHRAGPIAPAPVAERPVGGDSVDLKASSATAETSKVRVLDGQVTFDTGSSKLGKTGEDALNKTLDALVATIKTLPPEKQKALLADPNFKIEIEGRSSNLGTAHKYDNVGLSKKRADETAAYVKEYLKARGLEVPEKALKSQGTGTPGSSKAADNNDPADRSAKLKISLPGLDPLPPARPTPSPPPARSGHHAPATHEPPKEPAAVETPAVETPAAKPTPSPQETALAEFNKDILPINGALSKGQAAETTLSDRETLVTQTRESLKQAEDLIPKLDPNAQPGAQALVNGLKDQVGHLADRATKERGEFDKLKGEIKGEGDSLTKAEGAKKKTDLHKLVTDLLQKYKDPEALAPDLPKDARETLKQQVSDLKKRMNEAIVRNSDNSDMDRPDNSYLFGRPGPKFKENWDTVQGIVSAAGTPNSEQRQKAAAALAKMAEALKDFDDPMVKAAAQAVYDDVSKAAFARLSKE